MDLELDQRCFDSLIDDDGIVEAVITFFVSFSVFKFFHAHSFQFLKKKKVEDMYW